MTDHSFKPVQSGQSPETPDILFYKADGFCAGTTMKNPNLPESGNQCLYLCTSKHGVMENRKALSKKTLPLSRWVTARQRHTDHIVRVFNEDAGKGSLDAESAVQDCDGLYTTEKNLLLGVYTADCLGILLTDPTVPLCAAVHSGWKGTTQAILFQMLDRLQQQNLLHPETIQVFFSPSLMAESLEVGEEVIEQIRTMAEQFELDPSPYIQAKGNGKYLLDNQGINMEMCRKFSIPEKNLHPSSIDTLRTNSCFSYRKTKPLDGEHFTFVYCLEETADQN